MSASPTLIAAPLAEELAPLRAALTGSRRLALGLPGVWTGALEGAPVVLAVTGDGPRQARAAADRLLGRLVIGRVVLIGVAGALSPELAAGTLLVGARVHHEETDSPRFAADPALVRAAVEHGAARPALLVTARQLAATPDDRRRLLRAADARELSASAAVDTESAALVERVVGAGLPWLVLRAISDTTRDVLPALLERCRDDGGALQRARVARALVFRPAALAALVRLRSRVERCAEVLATAVRALVAAEAAAERAAGRLNPVTEQEAQCPRSKSC